MGDVLFLILRRLRAPLLTLIVVYAISVGGLTLMPGVDANGQPARLGFFHAFYVMSYTATTIGFGEVPHAFSEAQRAWVILSIYLSVVGWAYAVGSVFALTNDATFRAAVSRGVFAWRVRGIAEPFFIICGYGQSGSGLARALDDMGIGLVIIETRPERAAKLAIEDYVTSPLVLCADAKLPDVLEVAGIHKPECQGLMALAGDDAANQAIAIGARVLNDGLRVVARAKSQVAQVNLESFGGVTVINPFETFATNLALDLGSPEVLRLEEWLTSAPGSECPSRINVPRGTWVLVGFGRFGRAIAEVLDRAGISWTAIDSDQALPEQERLLAGDNTEKVLRDAGIAAADVLVAGTDVDAVNLGVTTLARRVNADLFVVIRQNDVNDSILIQAAKADLRFVQADLVVHECLQELKTPMLGRFLLRARSEGGAFAARAIERISDSVGTGSPRAWTFHCDVMQPGIFGAFFQNPGESLPLRLLCRDVSAPDHALRVTPLMVERRAETLLLPGPEVELKPGDRVLFVGDDFARRVQQRYLMEPGAIEWVRSGVEPPRSWVFRRLMRRRLARTEQ